ncbi:MAG: class I SAM-dependent methyltransferase [Deltaproteobacteria bacterium]|nr:class I SAM-dependent methyltransferase [Deltaproteobacteria bacterium]
MDKDKETGFLKFAKECLKPKRHYKDELARYKTWVPPGHYYSPVPNTDRIRQREAKIWSSHAPVNGVPGIDLNEQAQLRLMDSMAAYYGQMPFDEKKKDGLRYYFDNPFFCHTDAIVYYSILRHMRPKMVIEAGSGFSSAVLLDTNELFFKNSIKCSFIEPFPERLNTLLKETDSVKLIASGLQDVEAGLFKCLGAGDILFIDSTHVSKTDSDVNQLLFEILPSLESGVYIHFHDIFYPFEYPKEWVYAGRAWNEAYILRAYLQYNRSFRIVFFNSYMHCFHAPEFAAKMPLCMKNTGGSLWIEKI